MFRPFQYSNNNRRQMQNRQRQRNDYTAGQRGNIMYPTNAEFNNPKEDASVNTFKQTMSIPNIIPTVNGEPADLTEPDVAEFLRLNPKKGFLKMRVTTARGALPVYNAVVSIYKSNGDKKYLIATETTDLNGLSIPIPLPAPDKSQTFNPENPRPYADYDIVIEHPEYKTVELKNIPVFDGISSVQNVNLTAYKESNPPTVINEGVTEPGR